METVLQTQLRRFLKQGTVHNVDDDGDLVKKTVPELLSVDVNDKSGYLGRKSVLVGQKCASLKDVGLTPVSPQVDFFYDKVYNFHKTMASKMQIYFEKGLNSTELEYMAAFSPDRRTKECTRKQILYLARSYSKIVNGISPTGFDQLKQEVELYQLDDNIEDINKKQSYNSYWGEVAALTEADDNWSVYEVLPRLARGLGTHFNSGSEMERAFSRQSDIHRDPKRNRMT